MGSAALTRQTSVLGAIRAITGLNRSFNRPGKSLGSRRQPQREAGQGRGGAGRGSPWTGSTGAGTPGTSAPRSPAAATSGASSCHRARRCCRRGCRSGRTSGGRPQTAAAAAAAPYPYTRTPGVSGPEGLGSPGGRASPKARPDPRPLGRPHSACSDERRRATGQAPEWGASDPRGNRPHPHPARLSLTGQPKPSRVT